MPGRNPRGPSTTGLDVRVQETHPSEGARKQESYLIDRIDKKDTIKKHHELFEKLSSGSLDMPGFFKALAGEAGATLLHVMETSDSEKLQLDAAKDILDRAGFGKLTKVAHAHAVVDHDTSKRELMNMILTSARKAGIKVKREDVIDAETVDVESDGAHWPGMHKTAFGEKSEAGSEPEVPDEGEEPSQDDNSD